jgi:hypothetical protein
MQMRALDTSDYRGQGGYNWPGTNEDEEDGYPLYVPTQLQDIEISLTACS